MVPIGLPAYVWWPYMGHAGYPTFLLSASGVSSLYLCIISSPGTVTLDVMAESQMLWIVSPKLVTNEALLKKKSNISRLFLITLCLSLHHWSALRQQWPFALLPDHFWRRNLPDCTAGSGPLALRSVGELNCHFVQTTLVRLRAPERVAEQERGIRLMLMKCTSTVCQFVLSHAQVIIYTHWNLKCQISEKLEWLQMRMKSEMIYLVFSDLRALGGLDHCADELFVDFLIGAFAKKNCLKTFRFIVTIKWILEILKVTLLASLEERGPFYWS